MHRALCLTLCTPRHPLISAQWTLYSLCRWEQDAESLVARSQLCGRAETSLTLFPLLSSHFHLIKSSTSLYLPTRCYRSGALSHGGQIWRSHRIELPVWIFTLYPHPHSIPSSPAKHLHSMAETSPNNSLLPTQTMAFIYGCNSAHVTPGAGFFLPHLIFLLWSLFCFTFSAATFVAPLLQLSWQNV